jgi:SAM-dependent methyltransferase
VGCGIAKKNGWVNIDINPIFLPDILWDISKPAPFKHESVDEIYCDNVLEHLDDFVFPMQEFYKILNTGGKLTIIVPHFSSVFWDIPSHKRPFSYHSFHVFHSGNRNLVEAPGFQFSQLKAKLIFGKKYAIWNYLVEIVANLMPKAYEMSFLRSVFPCWLVRIELVK